MSAALQLIKGGKSKATEALRQHGAPRTDHTSDWGPGPWSESKPSGTIAVIGLPVCRGTTDDLLADSG